MRKYCLALFLLLFLVSCSQPGSPKIDEYISVNKVEKVENSNKLILKYSIKKDYNVGKGITSQMMAFKYGKKTEVLKSCNIGEYTLEVPQYIDKIVINYNGGGRYTEYKVIESK